MRPLPHAVALLGLLLAGFAQPAHSAPRIPAVDPPAVAREGGEYVTAIPTLPAEVEEFELFLLPEDGSGRWIRLTPEREVADEPLRWRMPRIAAARARLVLRAGGRFGETESEPSAAFAVEAGGPRERAELLRGEDELEWQFGELDSTGESRLLPPGATTIAGAPRDVVAIKPPRSAGGLPRVLASRTPPTPTTPQFQAPPAPVTSRRPAFVPLRN